MAKITVGGTDFEVFEQSPFNPGWWSFKKMGQQSGMKWV